MAKNNGLTPISALGYIGHIMGDEEAASTETTWDRVKDFGRSFGKGVVGLAENVPAALDFGADQLKQAVTGKKLTEDEMLTPGALRTLEPIRQSIDNNMSFRHKIAQREFDEATHTGDNVRDIIGGLGAVVDNPSLAIDFTGEQVPNIIAMAATGGAAGAVAKKAATGLIAKQMVKSGLSGDAALSAAEKIVAEGTNKIARRAIRAGTTGGIYAGSAPLSVGGISQQIIQDNIDAGRDPSENLGYGAVGFATALADPLLAAIPGAGSPLRMALRNKLGLAAGEAATEPAKGGIRQAIGGVVNPMAKGAFGGSATESAQEVAENAASNVANGDDWSKGWGRTVAQTIASTAPLGAMSGHGDSRAARRVVTPREQSDLLGGNPTRSYTTPTDEAAAGYVDKHPGDAESIVAGSAPIVPTVDQPGATEAVNPTGVVDNSMEPATEPGSPAAAMDAGDISPEDMAAVNAESAARQQAEERSSQLFDSVSTGAFKTTEEASELKRQFSQLPEETQAIAAAQLIGGKPTKARVTDAINMARGADPAKLIADNSRAIQSALHSADAKTRATALMLLAQRGVMLGKLNPNDVNEFLYGTGEGLGGEGGLVRQLNGAFEQMDDNMALWVAANKASRKARTDLIKAQVATKQAERAVARAGNNENALNTAKANLEKAKAKVVALQDAITDSAEQAEQAKKLNQGLYAQLSQMTSDDTLFGNKAEEMAGNVASAAPETQSVQEARSTPAEMSDQTPQEQSTPAEPTTQASQEAPANVQIMPEQAANGGTTTLEAAPAAAGVSSVAPVSTGAVKGASLRKSRKKVGGTSVAETTGAVPEGTSLMQTANPPVAEEATPAKPKAKRAAKKPSAQAEALKAKVAEKKAAKQAAVKKATKKAEAVEPTESPVTEENKAPAKPKAKQATRKPSAQAEALKAKAAEKKATKSTTKKPSSNDDYVYLVSDKEMASAKDNRVAKVTEHITKDRKVGRAMKQLIADGKAKVVSSVSDLPEHLRKEAGDAKAQAVYDPESRVSYFVAENLDVNNLTPVVAHELGVHMAYDKGNKEVMQPLVDQAVKLMNEGLKTNAPFAKELQKRLKNADLLTEDGSVKPGYEDEVYAYLVENELSRRAATPVVKSLWNDTVSTVRQWLTKHKIVSVGHLTTKDLANIAIANVREMAKAGKSTPPTPPKGGKPKAKFSIAMADAPMSISDEQMRQYVSKLTDADRKAGIVGYEGNEPVYDHVPVNDWQRHLERTVNDRAVNYITHHMEPGFARTALIKALDVVGHITGKWGPRAIFTRDLMRFLRPFIPSATRFFNTKVKKNGIRREYLTRVEDVKKIAKGLSQESRKRANELIKFCAVHRVFWTKEAPDYMERQGDRGMKQWEEYLKANKDNKAAAKAEAAFNSLSHQEQALVKAYFEWTYEAKRGEINAKESILKLDYDSSIQEAQDEADQYAAKAKALRANLKDEKDLKQAVAWEKKAKALRNQAASLTEQKAEAHRVLAAEEELLSAPYAPLVRLGDHLVIGKSETLRDVERQVDALKEKKKQAAISDWRKEDEVKLRGLRKTLEALKSNGKDYYVGSVNGAASAKAAQHDLAKEYPNLRFEEPVPVTDSLQQGVIGISSLNNVIEQSKIMLADDNEDAKTTEAIKALNTAARELLAKSLVANSIYKHSLKRLGVLGYEGDMLTALDSYADKQATHIATLATLRENTGNLSAMLEEKHSLSEKDREYAGTLLNEVIRRENLDLYTSGKRWTGAVARTNAAWMLFTNPGYYIQNMTQPFMMAVPYMAGRIKGENLYQQVSDTYAAIGKQFVSHRGEPYTIDDMVADKLITGEEAVMLKRLQAEGLLDTNMESEYGKLDESSNKALHLMKKASDRFMEINQRIEQLNRVATALVAYRNAKKHPEAMKGVEKELYMPSDFDEHTVLDLNAYSFTSDVIERTHGDYSDLNAPSFMRAGGMSMGGLEKLVFQFRKYSIIQMGFFAHMAKLAFSGATPQERAIGRRMLLQHLAVSLATCGMKGTFPLAFILWAGAAAFGDDDDDTESYWRRVIGNDKASDFLLHGMVAGFGGPDMGAYIGSGDLGNFYPMFQRHEDVPLTEDILYALAGPTGSQVEKARKGLANLWESGNLVTNGDIDPYFRMGNFTKAMEFLLPKGFSNLVKSVDYLNNGVTSASGATTYIPAEDYTAVDAMFQALGLPSYKQTFAYWDKAHYFENRNWLKSEKQDLVKLAREGKISTVIRRLPAYNRRAKNIGQKPTTLSAIQKSANKKKEQ